MRAVLDARVREVGHRFAQREGHALLREFGIQVGEGLAQPFRVAARGAPGRQDVGAQERVATADDLRWLALQRQRQIGRLAVRPVEHALVAVDTQPDVVLAAGRGLRDGEAAARAAVEFDQRRHMVDHAPPRHQRADVGDEPLRAHAGDKTGQVLRMAADRAHHQRLPAARRVEQPAQPVGRHAVFDPGRQAALDVFHLHQAKRANGTVTHQRARMPGHRVGRVRVRDGEQAPARMHALHQVQRLRQVVAHRLVADHVQAGVQRGRRVAMVGVVRGHDRHRLDAIVAPRFGFEQLRHIAVAAHAIEPERRPRGTRALRVAAQHRGADAKCAVEFGRAAVHGADPAARPAADDGQPQRAAESVAQFHRGSRATCGGHTNRGPALPLTPASSARSRARLRSAGSP